VSCWYIYINVIDDVFAAPTGDASYQYNIKSGGQGKDRCVDRFFWHRIAASGGSR
jgi:hypothetical protein